MIGLFEEGLQKFRGDADKELVLQLVVRYLKYLIAVRAEKEKIQAEFKGGMGGGGEAEKAFMVEPELNSPVFVLYLSYCNDQGVKEMREAVD